MKSKGLGGFNRKWGAIILLLAVIFISLALSQSRFFISYASASSPKFAVYEGLESTTTTTQPPPTTTTQSPTTTTTPQTCPSGEKLDPNTNMCS